MPSALHYVFTYIAIPILATIAGGALCVFYSPGSRLRIGIQHFTAGLVFAAVCTSLLPEMLQAHDLRSVIVGFTIGIGLMLGVKWFTQAKQVGGSNNASQPKSLVFAAGVDYVVDGLLMELVLPWEQKLVVYLRLRYLLKECFWRCQLHRR